MTGPSGPSGLPGGSPRPRVSRAAQRAARRKQRRRQTQLIAGGVAAALLVVGGGIVAVATGGGDDKGGDSGDQQNPESNVLADPKILINDTDADLMSKGTWVVSGTADGPDVPAQSFMCQAQRFADPAGVRTWARTLRNPNNLDTARQFVEVSKDQAGAAKAYATIAGWLSECADPQVRLVNSYQAKGLGEKGVVAVFTQPRKDSNRFYRTVVLATAGPATVVLEHNRIGLEPPKPEGILAAANVTMRRICEETGSTCGTPTLTQSLLPTDEPRGFMAPIDLPVISKVEKPWVSVKSAARDGTGCEKIDLSKGKALKYRWQTYVVPEGGVPTEFGMDTMVAQFKDFGVASKFVNDLRKAVDNCKKTYSTATVKRTDTVSYRGIGGQTWRIVYDAGSSGKLTYRVGVVRASDKVAYVMFPVLKGLDISDDSFRDLLIRAGERSLYFR
ncbi:hypothetical protein [Kribbella deserti]|uniref:PknH-like extracellular domain-containing protein n=1 Tax=Kribbella deserti TaxID=1926257 RepID=A0ABV6QGL5_9ACTN